jgi:hypothetical protein
MNKEQGLNRRNRAQNLCQKQFTTPWSLLGTLIEPVYQQGSNPTETVNVLCTHVVRFCYCKHVLKSCQIWFTTLSVHIGGVVIRSIEDTKQTKK